MNNLFIVSYECKILGNYFYLCNQDIQSYIKKIKHTIKINCTHDDCDRHKLHDELKNHDDNYIITIYAHGDDNRVVDKSYNDLINIDDTKKFYNKSIVYSTACKTAKKFGKELVENGGCKLFFGYSDDSELSTAHKNIFVEMDNFTLKLILEKNTINKEYLKDETEKYFNEKLKKVRMDCPPIAPMIMHNKECFEIY